MPGVYSKKSIAERCPGYLKEKNISIPADFTADDTETVVFLVVNNELVGNVALSDEIRPESAGDN